MVRAQHTALTAESLTSQSAVNVAADKTRDNTLTDNRGPALWPDVHWPRKSPALVNRQRST